MPPNPKRAHQLILVTIDQDFLDLHQYPAPHAGIVVARLRNARSFRQEVVAGMLVLASRLPQLSNTVQIIDPGGVVWQVTP